MAEVNVARELEQTFPVVVNQLINQVVNLTKLLNLVQVTTIYLVHQMVQEDL